jgi:hypothetical protein
MADSTFGRSPSNLIVGRGADEESVAEMIKAAHPTEEGFVGLLSRL